MALYQPTLAETPGRGAVAERAESAGGGDFNAAAHGLRGVAAVMVLLAHIVGGTARHIYQDNAAYVTAVAQPWFLGTFGVQLFFVISGFVIVPSALRYRPGDFALRRLLRIYPLFLVLSIVFVVMNAATNAYPAINNAKAIVSALLFINLFTGTEQLTPNAWSLSFEIAFYVLTCAVIHFTVRTRQPLFAGMAILAAIGFALAFPISIYFLLGVAVRLGYRRIGLGLSLRRLAEVVLALAVVFLASRGHFAYEWHDFGEPVVLPLIAVTGGYFAMAVQPGSLTGRLLDNRIAAYAGTISYSLYLVHPYVYFGLRQAFVRLGWFTDNIWLSMNLFAILVIAGSFGLSHGVHIVLERWPYEWVFRQRIYRRKAVGSAG